MFFTGVCDSVHGEGGVCLSACWDATPHPRADTPQSIHPQEHTPPRADPPRADTPLRADTPKNRHPPKSRHPLGPDTPKSRHPPRSDTPPEADSGIRSTSGRYASYWNAFSFQPVIVVDITYKENRRHYVQIKKKKNGSQFALLNKNC